MDSSFSQKDEIWFLRVYLHISNAVYPFISEKTWAFFEHDALNLTLQQKKQSAHCFVNATETLYTNWLLAFRNPLKTASKKCITFINPVKPNGNFTYLLTYLLTPWSRVLLEKLTSKNGNFTYQKLNTQKFYILITRNLCILYGSRNKQQILPYGTLKDRFS